MTRRLGWSAACLLGASVSVQLIWAQTQGVGCDGSVALKAGRSGACTELAQTIAGLLEEPAVARDHWGIAVIGMDGSPIYSLNEGQLFQPASNAKLFTTAAAMALLGEKATYQTKMLARGVFGDGGKLTGHVVLVGNGDANLSGRVLPYVAPVPGQPGLLFLRVPEGKTAKNRIHFDVWPTSGKRDEQVMRAIELGAVVLDDRRRADGTGWVVFADPDGNEFCIGRSAAERAATRLAGGNSGE